MLTWNLFVASAMRGWLSSSKKLFKVAGDTSPLSSPACISEGSASLLLPAAPITLATSARSKQFLLHARAPLYQSRSASGRSPSFRNVCLSGLSSTVTWYDFFSLPATRAGTPRPRAPNRTCDAPVIKTSTPTADPSDMACTTACPMV